MGPVGEDERLRLQLGQLDGLELAGVVGDEVERPGDVGPRADDDRAVQAVVDLAAIVGMVEVAAVLRGLPLVEEAVSGLDWALREAGDAVGPGRVELFNACQN